MTLLGVPQTGNTVTGLGLGIVPSHLDQLPQKLSLRGSVRAYVAIDGPDISLVVAASPSPDRDVPLGVAEAEKFY